MNTLVVIALGGACGAVLRFLVSNGVYQFLGREFPYGTLSVNVLGSFLIGLLTQTLILQRVILSMEYRSAILVGLLGSFTTFSTFSLETITLLEQGQLSKAALNISISLTACLLAVWSGILLGKSMPLGLENFPYGLISINALVMFLLSFIALFLMHKNSVAMEYKWLVMLVIVGGLMVLSSVYIALSFFELEHLVNSPIVTVLSAVIVNMLMSVLAMSAGLYLSRVV